MMDWNGNMSTGGWIFSGLGMLIILVLVVAAIVWIARELGARRDRGSGNAMSAPELLDRRLANGEINAKQYAQLRQTLVARPDSGSRAS
jgi:uncharacterized membrane protein